MAQPVDVPQYDGFALLLGKLRERTANVVGQHLVFLRRGGAAASTRASSESASGSRSRATIRARHSFRAIAAIQAGSSRTTAPPSNARCASTKVCWAVADAAGLRGVAARLAILRA
jgi:hypothetical protein